MRPPLFLSLALAVVVLSLSLDPAFSAQRSVAVTIDDLPGPPAGLVANDPGSLRANTRKLLDALLAHHAPAIGFVNEGKLFLDGEPAGAAETRKAILAMWLDAGFELGNHTYSHQSLNRLALDEFEADVKRGEPVTRALLGAHGMPLRYFRHPFLQVGLDLPKRRAFESFLREDGYTVAPVTIDSDEYVFAAVYSEALRHGDKARAAKVAAEYLAYMEGVVRFVEETSQRLLGREVAQVLLLHANALNADHFGELAEIFEGRGYCFTTLDEVLRDPAYDLPDEYVGAWGISWLHHWEVTAAKRRSPSPDPPDWIQTAYDRLTAH